MWVDIIIDALKTIDVAALAVLLRLARSWQRRKLAQEQRHGLAYSTHLVRIQAQLCPRCCYKERIQ
jgi:hypothetical protein